jgi:queuosine biosynthesis protein QueC
MREIVLNSGGFDSVVLMHDLKYTFEKELISLFFDYGQRNLELEREKARKVADKLDAEHVEIKLPSIDWSSSSLFKGNSDEFSTDAQYLEMRNLIFFSYAISFAESRGIEVINSAIIKANENGNRYTDTSKEFIERLNKVAELSDVEIKTKYSDYSKMVLGYIARKYDIKREDFISCNLPVDGEPCGECEDCREIENAYKYIVNDRLPVHAWQSEDMSYSEKFKRMYLERNINEARILNNNLCQFDCKHCFYGFDETVDKDLSLEEWEEVLDQLVDENVQNFHFSGKEPLFNESIFDLFAHLKEKDVTYDLVTNGENVAKYIDKIVKYDVNKVFVSVDSFLPTIRDEESGDIVIAIDALDRAGVPVEVFIDVHKDNKNEVTTIIEELNKRYNVEDFHVRPVARLGHAKDMEDSLVSPKEYTKLFKKIFLLDVPARVEFSIRMEYTEVIMSNFPDSALAIEIEDLINYGANITKNPNKTYTVVMPEFYCGRYESQVTVTSDGYILGCGTEVSKPNYDELAVGNVREEPVKDLILRGKREALDLIERRQQLTCKTDNACKFCTGSCYHTFNCLIE